MALRALFDRASILEEGYTGMVLQTDEVDERVRLWRRAIELGQDGAGDAQDRELPTLNAAPHVLPSFLRSELQTAFLKHRLAVALEHRYHHSFDLADVDECIALSREALTIAEQYPEYVPVVSFTACLGVALNTRYHITEEAGALDESFLLLSSAVHLSPSNPQLLARLASNLMDRWRARSASDDLAEALVLAQRAYDLRVGHSARGFICYTLATAVLWERQAHGLATDAQVTDLQAVLRCLYRESLRWYALGHVDYFQAWDGIAVSFHIKAQATSDKQDLDRAVHHHNVALGLMSPHHPKLWRLSINLANSLQVRYLYFGSPPDLETAQAHTRRAYDLAGSANQRVILRSLAFLAEIADEDSADDEGMSHVILLLRNTLQSVRDPWLSSLLGSALMKRGTQIGHKPRIAESVSILRSAVVEYPKDGRAHRNGLAQLAEALFLQYKVLPLGALSCLHEAISILDQLQESTADSYYSKENDLALLARAYRVSFIHSGHRKHLDLALAVDNQVLSHPQHGSRMQYARLAAVAEDLGLIYRDQKVKDPDLLVRAIALQTEAIAQVGEEHSHYAQMQIGLAELLLIPDTSYTDCERSFSLLLKAVQHARSNVHGCITDVVPVLQRVEIDFAQSWTSYSTDRELLLHVYQALIDLLPRFASLELEPAHCITILAQTSDLARTACAHALELNQSDLAIELLEAGRAVFWTQCLRLKASFDDLPPTTAAELRNLTRRLEQVVDSSAEIESARIERLLIERRHMRERFEALVLSIRAEPGMERFLRNLTYEQLSEAAHRGPIAILQDSWMCIIMAPGVAPQTVRIPKMTKTWLRDAVERLRHSCRLGRRGLEDPRGMKKRPVEASASRSVEQRILADLWQEIARPLIAILGWKKSQGRDRPRLFLCPTGLFTFLPIHAAGLYESAVNAVCLSEFCVVSYAPTINALLDSNRASAPSPRSEAQLLLATASAPFVMSPLPSVDKEAKLIIETVPTGSLVSPIPVNTAEDVLRLLPEATILHFACHGQQSTVHPLESGFVMQDKMIKVADLIRLNLPRARLAFLSACETAQGDMERPDEALHLAATMLYAGFKSVVGTMWSMDDIDGPVVAETLYNALFDGDGDGDFDFDTVPYALDAAVRKLRARGLGVSRWASYVHIGM